MYIFVSTHLLTKQTGNFIKKKKKINNTSFFHKWYNITTLGRKVVVEWALKLNYPLRIGTRLKKVRTAPNLEAPLLLLPLPIHTQDSDTTVQQ